MVVNVIANVLSNTFFLVNKPFKLQKYFLFYYTILLKQCPSNSIILLLEALLINFHSFTFISIAF